MPKTLPSCSIRIAYLGGGSRYWAQNLMRDLALCGQLSGELVLYDINHAAAQRNVRTGTEIFRHPQAKGKFTVRAVRTLPQALKGADFVVASITPGPMEMFANDIDIPRKYGILQTVGDTTGPGGLSRSLRSVPIYLGYAAAIMATCPAAWVINYTNPMTLCTSALYAAEPEIKAFGCCHEVFGTQEFLADLAHRELHLPRKPHRREIKIDVAGVNHFTFVTGASYEGEDLLALLRKHIRKDFFRDQTDYAEQNKATGQWFTHRSQIACDFLRRFGVLGAAGDRHLAEFVPWYLTSESDLHRWGVVLTPSSFRLGTWAPPGNAPAGAARRAAKAKADLLAHSGEEGVDQILALCGLKDLDTNVNVPNEGQIAELPIGAVVETNAQFRHDSLKPVIASPLPASVGSLVRRIVDLQALTLRAAIEMDKDMALEALLNDPLTRIPTDRAWKMLREMLRANRAMLPGWKL